MMASAEQLPKAYLYRRVVQAKLYIDSHFQEPINLDNIAGEAYFSKFHFIRLFRTAYGKTPHQYLIKVRINQAALLLSKGTTVTETCYAVGFDSVASFSALFKKLIKRSPLSYQQIMQQREQEIAKAPLKFIPNCFAEHNGWA